MASSTSRLQHVILGGALAGALLLFVLAVPGTARAADVVLHWTAPGDDGNVGTANNYLIRYSLQPIIGGGYAQLVVEYRKQRGHHPRAACRGYEGDVHGRVTRLGIDLLLDDRHL